MNEVNYMELGDEIEKSFPLAIHAPYDAEVDYARLDLETRVLKTGKS
jgi:hypothetical protein